MQKNDLERAKKLIKRLSAEDRKSLTNFLTEFPDSGFQSYDLREELEVLKKHGTRLASPEDDPDLYLINLVFVRNLVAAQIRDTNVLVATFFPDNFIEAFPKIKKQILIMSRILKERVFTEEVRKEERAARKAQGIEETDEEYEQDVNKRCDAMAEIWETEKAKRIAEQISRHLPGMVGDMMADAIKGQTIYDLIMEHQEFTPDKPAPSLAEFKRRVQDAAWRGVKPHLPSNRNTRTNPAWRSDENLKQYARRVNDRKLLATSIKDMYEECEGEAGWVEDLKQDSNYQALCKEVPDAVIAWAIKRVASEDLSSREREPLSIACEMARQELELPEQSIETLRDYYSAGAKLLRKDRNQRS